MSGSWFASLSGASGGRGRALFGVWQRWRSHGATGANCNDDDDDDVDDDDDDGRQTIEQQVHALATESWARASRKACFDCDRPCPGSAWLRACAPPIKQIDLIDLIDSTAATLFLAPIKRFTFTSLNRTARGQRRSSCSSDGGE